MFTEKRLMFLVCESPLHAGSGSELDFIDKPIQRERHTNFPKIESSSLKGAIRERFYAYFKPAADKPDELFNAAFGAEQKQQVAGDERQGGLAFTDARLLLFPVKSMKGVFAWITCPFVLKRFEEDMKRAEHNLALPADVWWLQRETDKAICFSDKLAINSGVEKQTIILEEYVFTKQLAAPELKVGDKPLNQWLADTIFPPSDFGYWNEQLKDNLVILSDNDFADFTELSTEVITRNQIDTETGTVKNGHLFTEEYLPADSVLYTVVMAHAEFAKNGKGKSGQAVIDFFTENMDITFENAFQAGGNATTGKGLMRTVFVN